jgi:hypothetical protein
VLRRGLTADATRSTRKPPLAESPFPQPGHAASASRAFVSPPGPRLDACGSEHYSRSRVATAASDTPAEGEKPQSASRSRWRPRIPTPLLVTLVGLALSAWLLPAFTRQWDDRQKARELRATFADEIATSTANALNAGKPGVMVDVRNPNLSLARLSAISSEWDVARLRIDMKLRAYYPEDAVKRWSKFGDQVQRFLEICALSKPIRFSDMRTGFYEPAIQDDLQELGAPPTLGSEWANGAKAGISVPLTGPDTGYGRELRQRALLVVRDFMLKKAETTTAAILASHPGGYSTTTGDLLRDLIP